MDSRVTSSLEFQRIDMKIIFLVHILIFLCLFWLFIFFRTFRSFRSFRTFRSFRLLRNLYSTYVCKKTLNTKQCSLEISFLKSILYIPAFSQDVFSFIISQCHTSVSWKYKRLKVWIFFQKSFHFIAYLFINISSDNLKLLIINVSTWNFKIVIAVVDRLFSQTNQIDAWHISKRNKSFSWQLHWAAAVPKYL